jgi:four helix bundle protein
MGGSAGGYRKLEVWDRAPRLTLAVYEVTASFPREEDCGLTSQMRRSSSSIPANIAEGCGRNGDADLIRFRWIATGSANELDYHLLLARDLALLEASAYDRLAKEAGGVRAMLASLIRNLKARPREPSDRRPMTDDR